MLFLLRWGFAFALVAATFNPTNWNYVYWAQNYYTQELPLTVLFGLVLLIGYLIYLRATFRSIGAIGMFLIFSVFAAFIWVLWDRGIIKFGSSDLNAWMGILGLSFILGIGLSWSFVRRAITGQFDVDDSDD
ncbi:MAG: DUF6524 family protein [Paracoccaceae bacterium]